MKKLSGVLVSIVVCVVSAQASAGAKSLMLRPDSPICESESYADLLTRDQFKDRPGSEIMTQINQTAEFQRLTAKMNGLLKNMASDEEKLGYLAAAQGNATGQEEAKAITDAQLFEQFAKRCMATKEKNQSAIVLESRPISGLTRIRTKVNGGDADVWTTVYYLLENSAGNLKD